MSDDLVLPRQPMSLHADEPCYAGAKLQTVWFDEADKLPEWSYYKFAPGVVTGRWSSKGVRKMQPDEFDRVLARFAEKCATEERQRLEANKLKGEIFQLERANEELKRQLVAIQKPKRRPRK